MSRPHEPLVLSFETQAEWEAWLRREGSTSTGLWLRLAKKSARSQAASLTYAEALEGALCHGWIDGQRKSLDEAAWLQRFTPRTARSIWSEINKAKAEALIAAGRMSAAGLREVERAREDGRWAAAYAPASTATVPADLQRALDANPQAKAFFALLDSRNRYAVLFRIQNVKKAETRVRKIAQFVEMLGRGEKLHP